MIEFLFEEIATFLVGFAVGAIVGLVASAFVAVALAAAWGLLT